MFRVRIKKDIEVIKKKEHIYHFVSEKCILQYL